MKKLFKFVRVPPAPKAALLQPVLREAVARTKEQASWAGSAPNAGRTARTGASVASHFSEKKGVGGGGLRENSWGEDTERKRMEK